MHSISSTTSSLLSSSLDKSYSQITEIKSEIDFKRTPLSLKKLRLFLLATFITIIGITIALFELNITSKSDYDTYINEIHTEKMLKNQFYSMLLATLGAYMFGNLPKSFNES